MPSAHSREREDELKDCMKELAERIRRDIRAPVQSEREASLFPVEKSELYAAHDLVASHAASSIRALSISIKPRRSDRTAPGTRSLLVDREIELNRSIFPSAGLS
jgi:hypothetical protein